MKTTAYTLIVLGLQLGLGAMLLAAFAAIPLPRRHLRPASLPPLRRLLFHTGVAAMLLSVGALLGLVVPTAARPLSGFPSTAYALVLVVALSPAAAGCSMLLLAGRVERRGQLRIARRLARQSGGWCLAGVAAFFFGALAVELAGEPIVPSVPTAFGLGMAGLAGSAVLATLSGLAGKPRPSGALTVLAYVGGLACMIHGTH